MRLVDFSICSRFNEKEIVTVQGTFPEANYVAADFAEKFFHNEISIESRNI